MRYLEQKGSGYVFPWTAELAKRQDMTEVSSPVAAAFSANVPQQKDGGPLDGGVEQQDESERSLAESILAAESKEDIEAIGAEHGFEVDKRKKLETLKAELLDHLGLA